jgi:hypothetical protein
MKTRTKYVLCIMAGFAAGGILSFAYSRWSFFDILKTEITNDIWTLHKTAADAYYDEPNKVAITALNYSITTLNNLRQSLKERYYGNANFTGKINSYFYPTLAAENAMIGNLYKKLGNAEKSKYYFDLAISLCRYIKSDVPINLKTEEDFIKLLDETYEARKQNDQIIFCLNCFYEEQKKPDFNDYIRDINF